MAQSKIKAYINSGAIIWRLVTEVFDSLTNQFYC
jgi:hypothetical protein